MSTTKRKRNPWIALIVLLVVVGLIVGGLSLMFERDPVPKNDPQVRSLTMTQRKSPPVSKGWDKMLRGKSDLKGSAVQELVAQLKDKKSKQPRWFHELPKVQAALAKLAPHKKAFLAQLKDKGCPPSPLLTSPKNKAKRVRLLPLVHHTKLISLDSIAMAQAGKPDTAAAQMKQLMDGLASLSARCSSNLISAMIHVANAGILAKYSLYLFRHPSLSAAAKTSLLKGLRGLMAHNMMPDAMRGEYAYQLQAVDSLTKHGSKQSELKVGTTVWPWWDAKLTKEWMKRYMQVAVHRATQPFGPALWKIYPIENFINGMSSRPKWKIWFQYNAVGLVLLGVAAPVFGKFVLKFHQGRCEVAAAHAAALAMARKHKLPMPTDASLHKVINPLTKKPFPSPLPKKVCAIHKPGSKVPAFQAKALRVPPVPPAAFASDASKTPTDAPKARAKTPPRK